MTLPEISPAPLTKLWIYTNYDCNLRCSYCVAESSPQAARRALSPAEVRQLVDEAAALGFDQLYFTGGEPFLLAEIYALLDYAVQRLPVTVLTNAMLLRGRRLEQLRSLPRQNLTVQVSLDGASPAQHDLYRGPGSWARTVAGLQGLLEHGFRVRIATTLTPVSQAAVAELCAFHQGLGIPEDDHLLRPLARRGFSQAGVEVCKQTLAPELTVCQDGVYWHPLSTDPDMLVRPAIFPLAEAVSQARAELQAFSRAELKTFQ